MDDLLAVNPWGRKAFKQGSTPIAMEFQVNRELHPYLVTAAGKSKFIWLPKARNGRVRAAFREEGRASLFLDIVKEVAVCGRDNEWDNVFGYSPEGLMKAVEHLRYYGISEVEVLIPAKGFGFGFESPGVTVSKTKWVPEGMAVAVPKDRNCLGFVADLPSGSFVSVVHNPSRGLAVAVRDEHL